MHKKLALIGIFVSFAFIINLSFVFAQTIPDTTPPTVSITTPPRSAPVSGSILIQAQATDNVKIYGVNFYVDGQKINYYEDRYAPFSTYFNTIKFQNGAHEVIAVARDTSNNYATSSPFVITASNRKSVVPTLIVAPSYSYNGTTTSQRNANITAKLYGTAAGSANYYFYCNSVYSLSTSTSTEPDGKYLNVNSSAQIHKCSYPSSGTYYPKVVVERDGAVAQRRSTASIRPPAPVIKFSVGDKIKVGGYTSTKVNVRSEPSLSGAIVGTQTYNSQGVVLEGPIYSGGYWWWKIDFDNGADGWSAGNYFVKTVTAPVQTQISDIQVLNITPFSASIQWLTNIPTDGQVEFSTSPCPCANASPWLNYLSAAHIVELSNLTPGATYYYRIKSRNATWVLYASENQTFTTISDNVNVTPPPDVTAPIINTSKVIVINPYSVTISWFTDEPATSQVEFGTSPCPCAGNTPLVADLTTSHAITLYSLNPATTYYYRVKSKDAAGNLATNTNPNQTFSISLSDIDGDGISDLEDPDDDNDSLGLMNDQGQLLFRDEVEKYIGTNSQSACNSNNVWPSDVNNDFFVDDLDAVVVKNNIGGPYFQRYDLNMDGIVNDIDVAIVNRYYRKACGYLAPYVAMFSAQDIVKVFGLVSVHDVSRSSDVMYIGSKIGEQPVGAAGIIVDGPIYSASTLWWKVDFESGSDGWVKYNYITK